MNSNISSIRYPGISTGKSFCNLVYFYFWFFKQLGFIYTWQDLPQPKPSGAQSWIALAGPQRSNLPHASTHLHFRWLLQGHIILCVILTKATVSCLSFATLYGNSEHRERLSQILWNWAWKDLWKWRVFVRFRPDPFSRIFCNMFSYILYWNKGVGGQKAQKNIIQQPLRDTSI